MIRHLCCQTLQFYHALPLKVVDGVVERSEVGLQIGTSHKDVLEDLEHDIGIFVQGGGREVDEQLKLSLANQRILDSTSGLACHHLVVVEGVSYVKVQLEELVTPGRQDAIHLSSLLGLDGQGQCLQPCLTSMSLTSVFAWDLFHLT